MYKPSLTVPIPTTALIFATSLALLIGSTHFAVAACILEDVASRTWAINATEVKNGDPSSM